MINDNYRKVVSRNYTNDSQVTDSRLPKSGFNLGYSSKYDGIIGRLHVGGVNDVMPGDKFEGFNSGSITMNQIVAPITSNLQFRSHNFYVKYRAIDSDFEELMSPSKLNNMGAGLTPPMFDVAALTDLIRISLEHSGADISLGLQKIVQGINSDYDEELIIDGARIILGISDWDDSRSSERNPWYTIPSNTSSAFNDLYVLAKSTYCEDTLLDLYEQVKVDINQLTETGTIQDVSVVLRMLKHVFDFFVGEGSQLERLGYIYADTSKLNLDNLKHLNRFERMALYNELLNDGYIGRWLCYGFQISTGLVSVCTTPILQNEYKLRAVLSIWIEYYRNIQLEPLTTPLRYRKWDSVSFLPKDAENDNLNEIGIGMLITRCVPWSEDLFTTAHSDDVCRHVFVPIVSNVEPGGNVTFNTDSDLISPAQVATNFEDVYAGITQRQIQYFDSTTNQNRTLTIPLPSKVGNQFVKSTGTLSTLGLDLFTMRQTERLERWLKRNFYFGDEYIDRTLSEFNVQISDNLLPKFYGGSIDLVDVTQQVAQVGTNETQMGYRQAIGSANSTGDGYGDFAEEFGCVIQLVSMIPQAQYDPTNIQNTYGSYVDFPKPVFANSNESIMHNLSLSRSLGYMQGKKAFGNVPYAYEWRSRVNEVHGKFLNEYSDWSDIRFFGYSDETLPKLNYQFIHCRPMIGYMQDKVLLDGQWYMIATHGFNVERTLPAPVEVI